MFINVTRCAIFDVTLRENTPVDGRSRREYLEVIHSRYRRADLREKQVILNELCRNTGYNRKYAIRLLNGPPPSPKRERPRRQRTGWTWRRGILSMGREAVLDALEETLFLEGFLRRGPERMKPCKWFMNAAQG